MRQFIYFLIISSFLCPLSNINSQAADNFHSPYNSPVPEKTNIIVSKKSNNCPDKPKLLLISDSEWCEIYNNADKAISEQGLSEKLGHEKALSIMLGLVFKESSFRKNIKGRAGEIGLTQIMPSTGQFICQMKEKDLFNAENNLNCSAKYLNLLLSDNYFAGDLEKALIAYNQGWGNVQKGIFFVEDIHYANLIMHEYAPLFVLTK